MKILFIISFVSIFTIYFLYPVFLCILGMIKRIRIHKKDIQPTVSLIIPAHNEEAVIEKKLSNLRSLEYLSSKLEIIVVLDGCTDATEDRITSNFQDVILLKNRKRRGKIYSLNKAIKASKGEIIFFNDADVFLKKDSLKKIVANFNDSRIGCVGGKLVYFTDESNLTTTEKGESFYWNYETFLRKLESNLGYLTVVSGSFYAARKSLLQVTSLDVSDDLYNPIMIVSKGYHVIFEEKAVAYAKSPKNISEELLQKTRMITQGFKVLKICWLGILKSNLIFIIEILCHKFFRWLVFVFLMLMFTSNLFLLNEFCYLITMIIQGVFYLVALWGYYRDRNNTKIPKVVLIPYYFCLLNAAALMGLFSFLLNIKYITWEKAESTR